MKIKLIQMKGIFLLTLMIVPFLSTAQNTTYFMERMPQKISFNPAFVPEMNFYLGLPGIGGVTSNIYNSGFNYNELDYFLDNISDPGYNPDDFANSIGETNRLNAELHVTLLSFGFRTKKDGFVSFNVNANNISSFSTSSDIAYLLADVDEIRDEDFPIQIDGVDLITNSYITYIITYSRKINNNLTLGISPKINFNQFGIETNNIGYRIELEKTNFSKKYTQYPIGEVLLGMPVAINPDAVDGNELDLETGLFPESWPKGVSPRNLHQNASFAMDLGATYQIRKWMFSASLINIGASTWQNNAYRLYGSNEVIQLSE